MIKSPFVIGFCIAFLSAVTTLPAQAATPLELTIADNVGREWHHEPISWEVTLPAGQWQGSDVLVQRDGKPLTAQVLVTSRHADGSVKTATIAFIVDALGQDARTRITAQPGQVGPKHSDLKITRSEGMIEIANNRTAFRVIDRNVEQAEGGEFSPLLGIRTASGKWTGTGTYECATSKPLGSQTELIESGPVRATARVTTLFPGGWQHVVTLSLLSGSPNIEVEEDFNVGPHSMYQFKTYQNEEDELAWEWWSWYGDRDGTKEDHPNKWVFRLNSPQFTATHVDYYGKTATDSTRGNVQKDGTWSYALKYDKDRQLEKYLAGHTQWRPDSVLWYAASASSDKAADSLGLYTHSVRKWRNPNVLPLSKEITLRTGANDLRILSQAKNRQLVVHCPIGLGHRTWVIRVSSRGDMLAAHDLAPTALDAERVQRCMGLDITRQWITDWNMDNSYPRLFINPRDKAAYYSRFKGKDTGMTWGLGGFLVKQDRASFEAAYKQTMDQADAMILGYVRQGMDNSLGYPGWMLGYWHGMIVAAGVDNLLGSPFCTPEMAKALKKKLAILTYCLVSQDSWPDKQINYGWGSMNMPVGRWGGLVVMASALSDHPHARHWLKDASRYFHTLLRTEYAADGSHKSCPHYIGASVTSFYSWIILANNHLGPDVSREPILRNFARFYAQLLKPIDPRWGIRTLLTEGDSRPGSSPFPAILARFFKDTDRELAGQLMQLWKEGGKDLSQGMGIPDIVIIDPALPPRPPQLRSEVFPGFGAFLRYRQLGTPQEAYLAFMGGNFLIDHANEDQFAFDWTEKGVPLTCFMGDMYVPGATSALSHNTICWDYRPEGAPCPGKDRPGCWYHDHGQPHVDHVREPRRHLQVACDPKSQQITDERGMVTQATDCPGAALLEGQVDVRALSEWPTRANYSLAVQQQFWPPARTLDKPFRWTRRLLYVKAPTAEGMNYLVIRDDFGGFQGHVPSFNYWSLAKAVDLQGTTAHFTGQLGVDTDLFVAVPQRVQLFHDTFTHDQCEPIVGSLHQARYGKPFSETQVLCRVAGVRGTGFLTVVFPYKAGEERPKMEPWLDGLGVKVSWKGQTHYVLLDTQVREIERDGIKAKASALVLKYVNEQKFKYVLPLGGSMFFRGGGIITARPGEHPGGHDLIGDGPPGRDLLKEVRERLGK